MENTQNITINRLAALMVAVFVLVFLAVPSFGYTDNSLNNIDFEEQPIPVRTNVQVALSDKMEVFKVNGNALYTCTYYQDAGIYCFLVNHDLYWASQNNGKDAYYAYSGNFNTASRLQTVDQNTNLYYSYNTFTGTLSDVAIPEFSTVSDGFNAVLDWINNPPSDSTSQPLSLALQPGNVAYIDITNTNATITLSQHTSVAYWQLTSTQYIGASNSLPSSGFTVPIAGTGMIDWVGVGRKTIQGQYNDWTSVNQISGSASNHQHVYAIVVNPLQNNVTTGSGLDVSSVANGIINISVDTAWSVKIYQLENQFSLGVDSNTQSGDTGTGTYDSNTGQWTYTNDQTGESFDQQFGGMTTPDSQFDSIHDFLENIANTISGFFTGAINAVSTLVGAGSSFFGVLGGLYSWLPPAVYSVLVSALIIVITIGVIKVFV